MQLIDYLGFIGLVISLAVGITGWFWEFSKKSEGSTRKHLTRVGKYALTATVAVAAISVTSTMKQGIARQRATTSAIAEKERLRGQLNRLITAFDLDSIDVWLRLDNDHELIRRLRGGDDSVVIRASSGDSLTLLTEEQRSALVRVLQDCSEIGLVFYPPGYTGEPINSEAWEFALWVSLQGQVIEDIPVKWSIISWRAPKTFTDIELTIPAAIIDIPGGLHGTRSFSDMASKVVFIVSKAPKATLLSLQLYSRNRIAYPLVEVVNGGGKPLSLGESGTARVLIPSSPPWVPE